MTVLEEKSNKKKNAAKRVASFLDAYLGIDANSASCGIVYQPKAPEKLARYKKRK